MTPHTPKPRLRVTGGILLGSIGDRKMAFAEEEEQPSVASPTVTIIARKPYQIIGFPQRQPDGTFRIRPHNSRYSNLTADAWQGEIPAGGCQFFIRDEYSPGLTLSGGSWRVNGTFASPSCEIVQKEWSWLDTESRPYAYDAGTGVVSQTAIMYTRISVVYEEDGVYYLSNAASPDDGTSHASVTFPDDFITDYTL